MSLCSFPLTHGNREDPLPSISFACVGHARHHASSVALLVRVDTRVLEYADTARASHDKVK